LVWGGRATTNYEAYIAVKPDLVFIGVEKEFNSSNAEIIQEKFGSIPVVCIENSRNATGYEKTIRFMEMYWVCLTGRKCLMTITWVCLGGAGQGCRYP
jgi:hypothetical protein